MVYSVAKGLNQMPRGLKVSRLLIVNIILLSTQVTLKVEIVYIMTLVQHIGILEMIVLRFGMQGEDIVEHTINQQVSCLRFSVQEEVILKHTMSRVICVYFSQLVDHCVAKSYTLQHY